jgi:hypothetical protein
MTLKRRIACFLILVLLVVGLGATVKAQDAGQDQQTYNNRFIDDSTGAVIEFSYPDGAYRITDMDGATLAQGKGEFIDTQEGRIMLTGKDLPGVSRVMIMLDYSKRRGWASSFNLITGKVYNFFDRKVKNN